MQKQISLQVWALRDPRNPSAPAGCLVDQRTTSLAGQKQLRPSPTTHRRLAPCCHRRLPLAPVQTSSTQFRPVQLSSDQSPPVCLSLEIRSSSDQYSSDKFNSVRIRSTHVSSVPGALGLYARCYSPPGPRKPRTPPDTAPIFSNIPSPRAAPRVSPAQTSSRSVKAGV